MISYIFDTSFLISLLDIDDINHIKAIELISELEIGNYKNKFFINDIILNETYTVLNYKKGFEFLKKLEDFFDGIEIIYLSGNNEEYISYFKMIKGKVSVADSSVLYDSYKYNLKMLTFDKEMLKISKNYL
ncbi:MAG: type II toxin-antitoxin system VapC family toxin [Candidatus Gracilibacteria bacterium]|nr:type II toxin-antitoxin system VapC family toxin [Candidatus Gracilibacteria bacterium]